MMCVHGIDMEQRCYQCPNDFSKPYMPTVACVHISDGSMTREVPASYVSSLSERMDDSISELARNVAGLTGVAEKLLEVMIEDRKEVKGDAEDSQWTLAEMELLSKDRDEPYTFNRTDGVIKGAVTADEVSNFHRIWGQGALTPVGISLLREALEGFARSRGVL